MMLRASDLSPGQVLVDGVKGIIDLGGYPVRVLSNVPTARWMRLGNTPKELGLAPWVDYAAEALWHVRTGEGQRTVHVQFSTTVGGQDIHTSALVPDHDPALGTTYTLPLTSAMRGRPLGAPVAWQQNFESGYDRWCSYDYSGGDVGGNIWYPATWSPNGGPDDGPHILTDDSRWRIDYPETPDSVFAFVLRVNWLNPRDPFNYVDFVGRTLTLWLSGNGLNLQGGRATFFVSTYKSGVLAFWHQTAAPLAIVDGVWTKNTVALAPGPGWAMSWASGTPAPAAPNFAEVRSFGIAFRDVAVEPTGVLRMARIVAQ